MPLDINFEKLFKQMKCDKNLRLEICSIDISIPHLTEHSRLSSESKMQLAREGVAAAATASKIISTALIMLNTVV